MKFEESFSKVRAELLGIATLGILLVHSLYYVAWPRAIKRLASYGGVGVCMFIFISGLGLYRSLKQYRGRTELKEFYRKRYYRVILPYLLIAGVWYLVKWIICEHDITNFFYELTTLSFWGSHQGAWYVAMLIPLYIVYPFYFWWLEKGRRGLKTGFVIAIWLIISVWLTVYHVEIYAHLSSVIRSYIIFAMGNYLGESMDGNRFPDKLVACIGGGIFVLKMMIRPLSDNLIAQMISNIALGILLVIISTWILAKVKGNAFHNALSWIGTMSLEIYLTNIFLSQAYDYFHINIQNGYLAYGMIVALGIGISWFIHTLLNRLGVSKA